MMQMSLAEGNANAMQIVQHILNMQNQQGVCYGYSGGPVTSEGEGVGEGEGEGDTIMYPFMYHKGFPFSNCSQAQKKLE